MLKRSKLAATPIRRLGLLLTAMAALIWSGLALHWNLTFDPFFYRRGSLDYFMETLFDPYAAGYFALNLAALLFAAVGLLASFGIAKRLARWVRFGSSRA